MANQFETTFIPQQPILTVGGVSQKNEPVNLALVLSLIVFFVTVSVAAGAYWYRAQVENGVREKSQILQTMEKDFSIDEINTYKRIDSRLSLAKKLVDEHTISSMAFALVESSTAQNVGLTSFSFNQDPAIGTVISLAGQAPSYAAVYFQLESWRAMHTKIKSVEASGMALDEKSGIVSFSAKLTIDPLYFESLQVIKAQNAEPQASTEVKVPEIKNATTTITGNISIP